MLTFGSLFAGIEGFGAAFEAVGMACEWQVEIDERCRAIERRHFPESRRYNDARTISFRGGKGWKRYHHPKPVDLVCGGFPCQDLSVAGKRAGLAGKRSGLWFEFARLLKELRPRWVVIENVTGLLSSGERRDMGILLGGLAELGYWWAYRVLDAQYFGVAQRRRRVFIVGHSTESTYPAKVLFEPESCERDTPPSRETGARVAASFTRGSATGRGVNEPGRRQEDDVNLVSSPLGCHHGRNDPDSMGSYVVGPLNAHSKRHGHAMTTQQAAESGHVIALGFSQESDGSSARNASDIARPITGRHGDPGVVAFGLSENQRGEVRMTPVSSPITTGGEKPGQGYPCIAEVSPCLGKESYSPSKSSSGQMIDFCISQSIGGVRRLTPVECERLQGFEDDWTAWGIDEQNACVEMSDSARYRMLGNAICRRVTEWIGRQIVAIEGQ